MKYYKISDILAQESVIKSVKHYGIEGTEQKIKETYSYYPTLKNIMLNAWRNIYFKKGE